MDGINQQQEWNEQEASVFLTAENIPFLIMHGDRNPSLSAQYNLPFYTQGLHTWFYIKVLHKCVQQAGWERFGLGTENEFGHRHDLLIPEFSHLGRGKCTGEQHPLPPKAKEPPPACPSSPSYHSLLHTVILAARLLHSLSPDSVLHSSSAYSQPFFPLLKTAHITCSYWILQPGSPLQQNFNILCRRLVSISCFEDNCSTTNSLLNPDLHFLEVLSN